MASKLDLYPSSPAVMDGGFGSTLEDLFNIDISKSPLWSGQQILDDPKVIVETHLAFLRAGAQIILTSTYQCSTQTFQQANLSEDIARNTMLKAVYLADEARTQFLKETPDGGKIKIALSLGPFAASLAPAQEFDGFYPPPYGPRGFSGGGENINSFGDDKGAEGESIDALARFHFERLLTFVGDPKAWGTIDLIAFETVPLVREVKAIRKAMEWLRREKAESEKKPWWISFVLPGGRCPETRYPGGPNLTVRELVAAAFGKAELAPVPTGIGVNCTPPDKIPTLIEEIDTAWQDQELAGVKPWLVLYPNSGEVYDIIGKTWKEDTGYEEGRWEEDLLKVALDLDRNGPSLWSGVVIGGCCRIGPGLIRRLRSGVDVTSAD